jgi:hypothetical protein
MDSPHEKDIRKKVPHFNLVPLISEVHYCTFNKRNEHNAHAQAGLSERPRFLDARNYLVGLYVASS